MATFQPSTQWENGKCKWNIRFTSLPHALFAEPNFVALPGNATKLLLALASCYVGNNNGHLVATPSYLKRFGFNSKDSIAKSLHQLQRAGYLIRTRTSVYKDPALYALTWLPISPSLPGKKYDAGIASSDLPLDTWRSSTPAAKGAA